MINNHKHSWLGWDWEKINYSDLINKPEIPEQSVPKFFNTTKSFLAGTHWTGDFAVTWVWFKPKLIQIKSCRVPWWIDATFSLNSIMEDWAGWFIYSEFWNDQSNSPRVRSSLAVRVTDTWGSPWTTADMTSFDDDWFTLDFNDIDFNVDMEIVCFW